MSISGEGNNKDKCCETSNMFGMECMQLRRVYSLSIGSKGEEVGSK